MAKPILVISLFGAVVASGDLMAHANFIPKDNLDVYTGRSYQEGTAAYVQLNLAHGCGDYATRDVVATMPTSVDLSGIAYTTDQEGNRYGGNALMGIKPSVDGDWRKIDVSTGEVSSYYNHGVKHEDVWYISWRRGKVPNSMYENLEFKADLPKLEGCVAKLRVYIPIVQYCEKGYVEAWVREPTPSLPEAVISPGYAPYIEVLRDLEANPLAADCNGGVDAEAYPSTDDIEAGLLQRRVRTPE